MDTKTEMLTQFRAEDSMQLISDFRWLLSAVEGRRILQWIVETSGIYSRSADDKASFGRRDLGLQILGKANQVDAEAVVKMMAEHAEKNAERMAKIKHTRY